MSKRFTDAHIEQWRRDGGVLIENFFTPEEIAPCVADMDSLYAHKRPDAEAVDLKEGRVGKFNPDQFSHIDDMPFDCGPPLNMLGLHHGLIDLAKTALGTNDVHLYQSHSWAKFTGQTDFDQEFHCDFKNHTLTVPSDKEVERTINIMIYMTDVTDAHGAIHYVPQPISDELAGQDREWFPDDAMQEKLKEHQLSGAGPAGSVFAYGIDVHHRGTNLTAPGGHRYTLTASFKAKGNDMIGWSAWPYWFMKPWHNIMDNADPEQLACLGIPRPGDPFWTDRTLKRTKERWPNWKSAPYEAALGAGTHLSAAE